MLILQTAVRSDAGQKARFHFLKWYAVRNVSNEHEEDCTFCIALGLDIWRGRAGLLLRGLQEARLRPCDPDSSRDDQYCYEPFHQSGCG